MNHFCTASYFCGEHQHGKLLNISLTKPKDFGDIETFSELIPSPDILKYWKDTVKYYKDKKIERSELDEKWDNYTVSYRRSLHRRAGGIKLKLTQLLNTNDVFTLLCWEKPNAAIPNCHRNLAGEWLAENFDLQWHQDSVDVELIKPLSQVNNFSSGSTVPDEKYLEIVQQEFSKSGVIIYFFPMRDKDEEDRGIAPWLFNVVVNDVPWGMWGKCGLPSVIHQIKKEKSIKTFEV